MKDAKKIQKKITFYGTLILLLRDQEFVESSAEALVQLFEEIRADVVIKDITVDFLRDVYDELADTSQDLDLIESITEDAFVDLAKHMRSPEVRKIFAALMEMSGIDENEDLFVHRTNVRHLTDEVDGCTVVTLVVHNYAVLERLLKQEIGVGVVHLST